MPRKLVKEGHNRDPIAHVGEFEVGDGDLMMRRSCRNFGPQDIDSPKQRVSDQDTRVLKKIFNQDMKKVYGRKYAERDQEPSMFNLLSGGLEAPLEGDYKKGCFERGDKPMAKKQLEKRTSQSPEKGEDKYSAEFENQMRKDLIYRINKSKSQYVSEKQDNFREYAYDEEENGFLYDYLHDPERKDGKAPHEIEDWMQTVYRRDYLERLKRSKKQDQQYHDFERDEQRQYDHEIEKENQLGHLNDDNIDHRRGKSSDRTTSKKTKNNKTRAQSSKAKGKKEEYTGLKKPSTKWDKNQVLKKSSDAHRKDRIQELHKWARWLPDSAYQSYFGKPAFHTYGKNNTKPTSGGVVYGQYLLSHNVNPEHGANKPKYQQTYKSAMNYGFRKGDRVPQLPRKGQENLDITPSELAELKKRNPIMPQKFKNPDSEDMYTEGSDNEYDFSHLKKNNKDKIDFHPQKDHSNNNDRESHDDDHDGPEKEGHYEVQDEDQYAAQPRGNPYQNPTPEPGTIEYKRMLEQFVNNPEYARLLAQEGGDLQNMFPFCSVHNSYGQQLPLHELDPRNYKFLPSSYINRIAPAGRQSRKCENLYHTISPEEC
jgi:hypothetical protein